MLEDRLIRAGSAGDMHDAPLLVELGNDVWVRRKWCRAIGHVRFSYGSGWWDELWLQDDDQDGCWLSLDEGDVIVQSRIDPVPGQAPSKVGEAMILNDVEFTLTETETAECIAVRGVLPQVLAVEDRFRYANFTSVDGNTLSRESHAGQSWWYLGEWIDPFELQVRRT
ncbi:MAG: DUF4178 domain-containing protein [Shimia thalassica]|uniref:DUF4178 domain-containing protein n=1 Tax=Shimia thalassica TaxID=1715693 RepID=UPI003296FC9A